MTDYSIYIIVISFLAGIFSLRKVIRSHQKQLRILVGKNSVDKSHLIEINGIKQWISVRGHDLNNPILLFLHGGPGSAFSGLAYSYQSGWEEFFTVVNWDQRGCGKSNVNINQPVTSKQLIDDATQLITYLRREYSKEKVFAIGHSWGAYIGLTLAKNIPKQLYGYVGLGQMFGVKINYETTYRTLIEQARKIDDKKMLNLLNKLGKQVPDISDKNYLQWIGGISRALSKYGMSWRSQLGSSKLMARIFIIAILSPDLKILDALRSLGGSKAYVETLFKDVHESDLRDSLGTQYDLPMIFISGKHDNQTPNILVKGFYDKINAPFKKFVMLENSAHVCLWEEPGNILMTLVNDLLPLCDKDEQS